MPTRPERSPDWPPRWARPSPTAHRCAGSRTDSSRSAVELRPPATEAGSVRMRKVLDLRGGQTAGGEGVDLAPGERPRRTLERLDLTEGEHEEEPAWGDEATDVADRGQMRIRRQRLDRLALHDQVVRLCPGRRRVEQVGRDVVDARVRIPRPRGAYGRLRDVERDGVVAESGDELRVVSEPAADD